LPDRNATGLRQEVARAPFVVRTVRLEFLSSFGAD
jgi:hypothetical protein